VSNQFTTRVAAAILATEASWNPRVSKGAKERVMADAAIDALRPALEAARDHIVGVTGARPGSDSEAVVKLIDAILTDGDIPEEFVTEGQND